MTLSRPVNPEKIGVPEWWATARDMLELMGKPMPFSTQYVVQKSKATKRQVDHWIRKGWVKPNGNGGTGNGWSWSKEELDVACLMARMVQAGIKVERAAKLARLVIENPKPDKETRNIKLGDGMWLVFKERAWK